MFCSTQQLKRMYPCLGYKDLEKRNTTPDLELERRLEGEALQCVLYFSLPSSPHLEGRSLRSIGLSLSKSPTHPLMTQLWVLGSILLERNKAWPHKWFFMAHSKASWEHRHHLQYLCSPSSNTTSNSAWAPLPPEQVEARLPGRLAEPPMWIWERKSREPASAGRYFSLHCPFL